MAIWKTTWRSHFADGTLISNGMHWVSQPASLAPDATADDVLTIVGDALNTAYINCLADEILFDSFEVSEILAHDDPSVPGGAILVFSGENGTLDSGDSSLPNGLVLNIGTRTGVARRWARGYMSMPCPLNTNYLDDNGNWYGTYLSVCQDFAALLDDDYEFGLLGTGSIIPVVYSRTRELTVGIDNAWAQIQGGIARTKPSWRRSRTTSP